MTKLYLNGEPLVWTSVDEAYDPETSDCWWQLSIEEDSKWGQKLMLKKDAEHHIKNKTIPWDYFLPTFHW